MTKPPFDTAESQADPRSEAEATQANSVEDEAPEQTLIEYPCHFPIKVMARNEPDLLTELAPIILDFDSTFEVETVVVRQSSKGNYVGFTVTVYVTSREQLDSIYRALHAHPHVRALL